MSGYGHDEVEGAMPPPNTNPPGPEQPPTLPPRRRRSRRSSRWRAWKERWAGWPESITTEQAVKHALVIAALGVLLGAIALAVVAFAVSAGALEQPDPTPTSTSTTVPGPSTKVVGPQTQVETEAPGTFEAEQAGVAATYGQALLHLYEHIVILRAERAQAASLAARWYAVGRCEEPGNGPGGIDWTADGYTSDGHFQGGLGISTSAWAENSAGMPSSALSASPEQQMIVASRIFARFGRGAWGCPVP